MNTPAEVTYRNIQGSVVTGTTDGTRQPQTDELRVIDHKGSPVWINRSRIIIREASYREVKVW